MSDATLRALSLSQCAGLGVDQVGALAQVGAFSQAQLNQVKLYYLSLGVTKAISRATLQAVAVSQISSLTLEQVGGGRQKRGLPADV